MDNETFLDEAGDARQVDVSADQTGQRLDIFVAQRWRDMTRAEAQRLIELPDDQEDGVCVNERRARSNFRLRAGDRVSVSRPMPSPTALCPESIPLHIVYEDRDLLVIDKPRGMVVHPAPGSPHGTLVNAVLAHVDDLSGIGGELRPGIVHRLDKDTSGLMVVAKNDAAHRSLQAQIQARTAHRRYQALVWGIPHFTQATVDAPIGRHLTDRKKMAVVTDPRRSPRDAVTELTVLAVYHDTFALLEARLQTGRTHQVRVHCAYIKQPIVGDPVYGGQRKLPTKGLTPEQHSDIESAIRELNGQALHAHSLAFDHPRTAERLSFAAPLPEPFQLLLTLLQRR